MCALLIRMYNVKVEYSTTHSCVATVNAATTLKTSTTVFLSSAKSSALRGFRAIPATAESTKPETMQQVERNMVNRS